MPTSSSKKAFGWGLRSEILKAWLKEGRSPIVRRDSLLSNLPSKNQEAAVIFAENLSEVFDQPLSQSVTR